MRPTFNTIWFDSWTILHFFSVTVYVHGLVTVYVHGLVLSFSDVEFVLCTSLTTPRFDIHLIYVL